MNMFPVKNNVSSPEGHGIVSFSFRSHVLEIACCNIDVHIFYDFLFSDAADLFNMYFLIYSIHLLINGARFRIFNAPAGNCKEY